jgi:hypothetical protein
VHLSVFCMSSFLFEASSYADLSWVGLELHSMFELMANSTSVPDAMPSRNSMYTMPVIRSLVISGCGNK